MFVNGNADDADLADFYGFKKSVKSESWKNPCSSAKSVLSAFPMIKILALAEQ